MARHPVPGQSHPAHLLARCIRLLNVAASLAKRAHAVKTARRARRALRSARGAFRTLAREAVRSPR